MRTRPLRPTLGRLAVGALAALLLGATPALAQEPDADASPQEEARIVQVKILGMSCPFCAYGVEQKLEDLEGVTKLDVELESGVATLTLEEGADVSNEKLKRTVEGAGFEAAAIARNFPSEYDDWNPEEIPGEGPDYEAPSRSLLEPTGIVGCSI